MNHRGYHQGVAEYIDHLERKVASHQNYMNVQEADLVVATKNYTSTLSANEKLREKCNSLQRERNELNRKLVEVSDLSDLRGKELAGAQVFLTKSDTISGQEVQDLVYALNEEIFQAAASLGDCVVRKKSELSDEDQEHYYDRVGNIVGEKTIFILSQQPMSGDHEINPLLVQIIVQIFLVVLCAQEINSWDPNNSDLSEGLQKVYEGMQASQQQSVCGRWRALTLAQIRTDFESWAQHLMMNFKRLLKVACWKISSQDQMTAFNRHLESIFKATHVVRRAIGQDVISEDYKVHLNSNARFRDMYMEEAYSDERSGSTRGEPQIVIGTTELGLDRIVLSPDKSRRDYECVVPPKVVLETTLETIVALHDRTRSSSKSASSKFRSYHTYPQDGRD